MNEYLGLLLAWGAGGVLGAVFFGGLWWTVHRGLDSNKPALWMFLSLLVRMAITLLGFYLAGSGDWRRLLACLVGFVMARQIVMRRYRSPNEKSQFQEQEVRHAP